MKLEDFNKPQAVRVIGGLSWAQSGIGKRIYGAHSFPILVNFKDGRSGVFNPDELESDERAGGREE
jgi:hypothetical protein